MNAAIFCGLVFGVGVAGLVRGIRPSRPLLKLSGVDAAAMNLARVLISAGCPTSLACPRRPGLPTSGSCGVDSGIA